MKRFRWLWVFAMMITWVTPIAASADSSPQSLTMGQAIEAALKQNPRVLANRFEVSAAASQVTTARSGLLPQVYLSETFSHTNSPLWAFGTKLNQGVITSADFDTDALNDPDAINNYNTALSLNWELYNGGKTRIGLSQARNSEAAAKLGLRRAQQQIVAQAAKAYVGLLLAVENHKVIVQSLETARAQFKLVQDRFDSGISVKSDLLRAQVRIANLEQQRLTAHSHIQVSQAVLHAAMGQPDAGPITPTTPFQRCVGPSQSQEQWVAQALQKRPDLQQFDIRKAIAEQEVDRTRAGHRPTLSVQGSYELNSEDFSDSEDNYTIGAVLRLNLYSGRRISSQTASAQATANKIKSLRKGMALQVQVETQRAFYQAQSAWKSIDVAHRAVAQAEEGLRIVGNRYGKGLLTIVDLLDAQVALQQARTQHFKALHDYKTARIELALAAGIIHKDFL